MEGIALRARHRGRGATRLPRWAAGYDVPANPVIELERPIVWAMLASLSPGRALDVASGTGRHTRRLVDLGHAVTGVDLTPEMLDCTEPMLEEAHVRSKRRVRAALPEAALAAYAGLPAVLIWHLQRT